jgi:NADP-reducing hydrogenase subunit HndB
MQRLMNAGELAALRDSLKSSLQERKATEISITVGMGTCGQAAGAGETFQALERELAARGVAANLRSVGCIGMCVKEPLVDIQLPGAQRVTYANVRPAQVPRLIEEHVLQGQVVTEWTLGYVPDEW